MRRTALLLAMLLASCSQEPDNAMNAEADSNVAATAEDDIPIPGGGDQLPPDATDDEAPAPPPENDDEPAPPGNDEEPAPPGNDGTPVLPPSGRVTLAAAPPGTSAGATMTLTLANSSRRTVGYNLCTSDLQTSAGTSVKTNRVCTMELRTLQPGRRATYQYELPDSLPDGRYRFSTGVQRMPNGSRITVTSNSFRVR